MSRIAFDALIGMYNKWLEFDCSLRYNIHTIMYNTYTKYMSEVKTSKQLIKK